MKIRFLLGLFGLLAITNSQLYCAHYESGLYELPRYQALVYSAVANRHEAPRYENVRYERFGYQDQNFQGYEYPRYQAARQEFPRYQVRGHENSFHMPFAQGGGAAEQLDGPIQDDLGPVDLVTVNSKSPYFVNRSTLAGLQARGDDRHPEIRLEYKVYDLRQSKKYWVDGGRVTFQQWLEKLNEGDAIHLDEFNLMGFNDLLQNDDKNQDQNFQGYEYPRYQPASQEYPRYEVRGYGNF